MRRVLVLINPKAGLPRFFTPLRKSLDRFWDVEGVDLSYQFTQSLPDGIAKVRRAVQAGVDTVLVVGGDGTVNSIGKELMGTHVTLGVVPGGSGNGFARHFGMPLAPEKAVEALAKAEVKTIDVGVVNDIPFLVTCSMAWDASLVRSFEKVPIRGILPYALAGMYEFFDYEPQEVRVQLDGRDKLVFPDPIVFTIANLTQYGGGAIIAPRARPDDGKLELVVAQQQHLPQLVTNIGRFFDGTIHKIPQVTSRSFHTMTVQREKATPIQVDGELKEAGTQIMVTLVSKALQVLVPAKR